MAEAPYKRKKSQLSNTCSPTYYANIEGALESTAGALGGAG